MRISLSAGAALLSLLLVQNAAAQSNYGGSVGTFPNWQERVIAELTNRARVDPAAELAGCPSGQCAEAACYSATSPLYWNYDLNQSARFHSASMARFPFFAHDTPCSLFSDLDARYPGTSDGSFAQSCSSSGTTSAPFRVGLFGASLGGENIAAGQGTPFQAFYTWLYESATTSACGFTQNNGHRYNILTNGPALGAGYDAGGGPYGNYWTQDFGGSGATAKIVSGTHWTSGNHARDVSGGDTSVEFWANWYDSAAPATATVVLDNVPVTMTRSRGTASNGAYSATVASVTAACHSYYFSFTDSSLKAVRYPETGSLGFGSGCPDFQGAAAPAAPAGVNAMATSATRVQVTWSAVTGASSYEIYRRDPGATAFVMRGTSASTSYLDSTASNSAYLYRVRAVNTAGSSADSAFDLATTVMFSDDPLAAGMVVRAAHLDEIRTAVNAVRAQALLGATAFTDATAIGVPVKALHITDLRASLDQAMAGLGLTTGGWTDTTLAGSPVRAVHFQELRNRVK